jgi:general secretion pathway protein N
VIRLALALMALALAGVLAYQWSGWPPPPPTDEAHGAHSPDGGDQAESLDPLARLGTPEPREAFASVTERPLFRPQRKPPEAEPEETPAPVPEAQPAADLAAFDLSAVVITPGLLSAWVRDTKGQELKRLRLGDELEGWAVREILSDRLVLERQGERNELLLRDFSKSPHPVAPPPRARPTPAAQRMPQRPNQRIRQRAPGPPRPGQGPGTAPSEPAEPRPNGPNP